MTTAEFSNDRYYVYEHISPSGKVYVGITKNINKRFSNKGKKYCTYNSIFSKAIEKYGWENIEHKILISNTTFKKACIIEKALINFYKKRNKSYNITNGGEGCPGRVLSNETKLKMSKSAHYPSEATFNGVRNSLKVKKQSRINLEKAYNNRIGSKHNQNTIILMKEKAINRKPSTKCINKSIVINSIPIEQIDKEGNVIKRYKSIKEASDVLNLHKSSISQVINNKRNSLFGLYFRKENIS